ncbi:MAG TPA: histidine kinase dimerization/phosphoacceptor domain -containing protein [Bryobacteraceae bacterium]|nr:histidine kinase dimerization/phosphoacceptor domain -containing protein [Bryobacteraceae bacterium]
MSSQSVPGAVRRKLNRLRRAARQAPVDPFFALSIDLLWISSLDGGLLRVNAAFIDTLGHPEPEVLSGNILDLVHPDDRDAAAAAIAGLADGNPVAGLEIRLRCADGAHKFLAWNCTPFPDAGWAYSIAHDRTRRHLHEEALRQSEARCICAIESTTDAFFAVDTSWRVVRVNQQAERLWMRQRDEVLGRNLWEVFPEAAGGPFHRMYEQAMRSGAPAHLEEYYPAPFDRWFEVHVYPSAEGLAVYFRDVTERRHADEKMNRTLQEKEVLLREVHHRVKNNLQVICSMLRLQERNLQDETMLQVLRECRERVLAMAMLHDQLHRAKDFSNINLGEYIRNLAASLFCSYGVNSADIGLHMDVEDISVFIDTAIPCGLIVNELVSNSLRHAFPEGRKGQISLGLHARPGGPIELTIADDGRGFPSNAQNTRRRSLGLWLVDLLAGQIGAAVYRSNDAGTSYRLVFQETESREIQSNAKAPDHVSRG